MQESVSDRCDRRHSYPPAAVPLDDSLHVITVLKSIDDATAGSRHLLSNSVDKLVLRDKNEHDSDVLLHRSNHHDWPGAHISLVRRSLPEAKPRQRPRSRRSIHTQRHDRLDLTRSRATQMRRRRSKSYQSYSI